MDLETLSKVAQLLGPAIAAWVSVKVGLSQALAAASAAMEKATVASSSANRAHSRIDSMLERQRP